MPRLAIAIPMFFYVSHALGPHRAEFYALAETRDRVTVCVRGTISEAPGDPVVLTLACDISNEEGQVLATMQFKDMLLH